MPWSSTPTPEHRLDHAFVGWWEDPESAGVHAYDAVHDREAHGGSCAAFAVRAPIGPLQLPPSPGDELDPSRTRRSFSGEQSNSSIAFGEDGPAEDLPPGDAGPQP